MSADVLPFSMSSVEARAIIREIAADTGRAAFVGHAKQQMRKRRINRTQVFRCLRQGQVVEGPYLDIKGYWRCKLEHLTAGDSIGVVAAFNSKERLLVITAM